MPRLFPLILLLAAPTAAAAPVPKAPALTAEQEKEFNDLWDGIDGRQSSSIQQFCRLVQQPEAIDYITRTVKPAKLSGKEAKQLIADLDSDDEAVWRAACRDLRNRDIRLALNFTDAWDLAKTERQKLRLGLTLCGYSALGVDLTWVTFKLEMPRRKGEKPSLEYMNGKGRSLQTGWSAEVHETFDELVAHRKKHNVPSDGDSVIVAFTLERIGTPAARNHLQALAEGHPDAFITREAIAALDRLKNPPAPNAELEKLWKLDLDHFIDTDTPNAFLDRPDEAVAFFKKNLRPVALTADGAKKLLARLLSDDKKEVLGALRELQVVDLALEMNVMEAFEKLETPEHRCRLAAAVSLWEEVPYGDITDDFDIDERYKEYDFKVGSSHSAGRSQYTLWKKWREKAPAGVRRDDPRNRLRSDTLCRNKDEIHPDRWYHEESAIYILDAIGTDGALAVIQDMATGHPDAGPTQAAKAVLKRRGK